jgi:DNA polymerase III delta prime subunit
MHSYLIVGRDEVEIEKQIEGLRKKLGVNLLEFPLAKIKDTRSLNSFLRLTVSTPTAILIKNADNATPEALNAFLKNLEEPQEKIVYILTASSAYNLLSTIVSRCQIIRTEAAKKNYKGELILASTFFEKEPGDKLLLINSIKRKEEAITFVEEFILGAHRMLVEKAGSHLEISSALKSAHTTLYNLKANGNVGLQLTNFVVSLS